MAPSPVPATRTRGHHRVPALTGAGPFDRATLHAVAQALRTGASDDPRVDAFTRQAATRQLRQSRRWLWIPALYAPFVMVAVFLVSAYGAQRVVLDICWVLGAALNATTMWQVAGTRRRAHRYLQNRRQE